MQEEKVLQDLQEEAVCDDLEVDGTAETAKEPVHENREINLDEAIEKAVERAVERLEAKFSGQFASAETAAVMLSGAVTGETGREYPDKRVDFSKLSYSELCRFLELHPGATLNKN